MAENQEKYLQLDEVIRKNKGTQGAVMLTLQAAQALFDHVPRDVQVLIAEGLGVPLSEIYGVATFYSQFALEPRGRFVIGVCLVAFHHGKFRIMGTVDALVSETLAYLVDTTHHAYYQTLKVEFRRNTHEHLHAEGVMERLKRTGVSASGKH